MSKDNFIDLHTAHTVIYDSLLRSPEWSDRMIVSNAEALRACHAFLAWRAQSTSAQEADPVTSSKSCLRRRLVM